MKYCLEKTMTSKVMFLATRFLIFDIKQFLFSPGIPKENICVLRDNFLSRILLHTKKQKIYDVTLLLYSNNLYS